MENIPCVCGHLLKDHNVESYDVAGGVSNTACAVRDYDRVGKYMDFCQQYKPDNLAYLQKKYETRNS